jgi:hypothetical protein
MLPKNTTPARPPQLLPSHYRPPCSQIPTRGSRWRNCPRPCTSHRRCPRLLCFLAPTENSHRHHGRELGKLTARLNRAVPDILLAPGSPSSSSAKFPEPKRGNLPTRTTPCARQDTVITALFFLSTAPLVVPELFLSPETYPRSSASIQPISSSNLSQRRSLFLTTAACARHGRRRIKSVLVTPCVISSSALLYIYCTARTRPRALHSAHATATCERCRHDGRLAELAHARSCSAA